MSLIHCLQGQLKVVCNFTTEVNLMHSEIQESQETQTSIPLTLVLTKTHTRRASGHLAPNVGSGLAQQKEADYSLSLSFTFHLFIFARDTLHFGVQTEAPVWGSSRFFWAAGVDLQPAGSIEDVSGCLVDTVYTSWHQNLCKVHSVTFEHLC